MTLGSAKLKRRVIISLLTILLICSVLAVFLVTINRANSRSSGENENEILEESSIYMEDDEKVENSTNIINLSSLEQIQNEKLNIIRILNENYDLFCQVESYFETDPGRYYCSLDSGELIIEKYFDGRPSVQIDNVEEIEVSEQIAYILLDLGFEWIGEADDYVSFEKITAAHPDGGTYWQGLHCNKSDAGNNRIEEWDDGGVAVETVCIRGQWFYYFGRNNA